MLVSKSIFVVLNKNFHMSNRNFASLSNIMTRDKSQLHNCRYFHNDIAQSCAFHVFRFDMKSLSFENLFVTINNVSNFFCFE
jgi:hypothetical protein